MRRGSPAEQQAASAWLQNFLDQPEAAAASLGLLRPELAAEIQFFAANMLLSAIKKHWTGFTAQQKEDIDSRLRQVSGTAPDASSDLIHHAVLHDYEMLLQADLLRLTRKFPL